MQAERLCGRIHGRDSGISCTVPRALGEVFELLVRQKRFEQLAQASRAVPVERVAAKQQGQRAADVFICQHIGRIPRVPEFEGRLEQRRNLCIRLRGEGGRSPFRSADGHCKVEQFDQLALAEHIGAVFRLRHHGVDVSRKPRVVDCACPFCAVVRAIGQQPVGKRLGRLIRNGYVDGFAARVAHQVAGCLVAVHIAPARLRGIRGIRARKWHVSRECDGFDIDIQCLFDFNGERRGYVDDQAVRCLPDIPRRAQDDAVARARVRIEVAACAYMADSTEGRTQVKLRTTQKFDLVKRDVAVHIDVQRAARKPYAAQIAACSVGADGHIAYAARLIGYAHRACHIRVEER